MPVLTVFAGPNGSGKSSINRLSDFEGKPNLLEADAIAKRMNPALPEKDAISAGREVLRRAKRYLLGGETLFDRDNVCVDSAERSIQQVRERVARGRHDVPDQDIWRR